MTDLSLVHPNRHSDSAATAELAAAGAPVVSFASRIVPAPRSTSMRTAQRTPHIAQAVLAAYIREVGS